MGIPLRVSRTQENAPKARNIAGDELRHGAADDLVLRQDTAETVAELVLRVDDNHGDPLVSDLFPVGGGGEPVSYTHLDVYKRQRWFP